MNKNLLWIWFAEAIGAGSSLWGKLLAKGHSILEIYQGDDTFFAPFFPRKTAVLGRLLDKSTHRAQAILDACSRQGIQVICHGDDLYPAAFLALENPPPVFYLRGYFSPADLKLTLGVVGTRNPTDYGQTMAYTLSQTSALLGMTVVSGLALGIDVLAHAGALSVEGKTLAVLASGVDQITPGQHKVIADHLLKTGAIISEYPPGTTPRTYHFPCRNRLVAALSHSLAVMEGKTDSGAMITARCAAALGKTVYALPGRVGEEQAQGPMQLLSQGARLLLARDTVAQENGLILSSLEAERLADAMPMEEAKIYYGIVKTNATPTPSKKEAAAPPSPPAAPKEVDLSYLSQGEKELYLRIPEEGSCLPDELLTEGVTAVQVMRWLTNLEIEGLISRLAGGRVSRSK